MNRNAELVDAKGKKAAVKKQEPVEEDSLEPCAKPQAQEASDFRAADDACDDGVH